MALRNFLSQRTFNWHAMAVQLDAQVSIGATGAPTLVTSSAASSIPTSRGIKSITRLSAGRYRVQFDDNYSQLLAFDSKFSAAVTGSAIQVDTGTAGLSTGTVYQIITLGTSTAADFHTLGIPAGLTPAVGMTFKAAATGAGSGTGTVKALAANAVSATELLATPSGADQMLNNQPFVQGNGGGYFDFQCLGNVPAGTITNGTPDTFAGSAPTATDPTNGTTMYLRFLLSNSKIG